MAQTANGISTGLALARQFMDRLDTIVELLEHHRRTEESSRKNFIGAGTVAGGGILGVQPQAVVNGNPKRRGFSFQNLGAAGNITLGLGTTSPQTGTGITLTPGQSWDGRVSGMLWIGSITMVGSQPGCQYSWLDA